MGVSYDPDINTVEEKLGALANEFFERAAAGDMPDVERFANQHPEFADLIREVFPTLATFGEQDDSADVRGTLGDFQIIRQIGRGGMGIVYEAKQLSMGRRVAIKVLPFASMVDPKPLARFRNEVRAVGTLEHPHIVSVYSVGQERGIHYFAMQLIRGQSMAAVIQELRAIRESDNDLSGSSIREIMDRSDHRESLHANEENSTNNKQAELIHPLRDTNEQFNGATNKIEEDKNYYCNVARLGIQAAEALAHAHEHGIIHRDIKPGNLMLDAHGQLYVTDFGLARIETSGVTMSHDWLGTPRYMSPEQASGKQVIDQRSDIYSLGVTLYELLTLQPAFAASDRQTLMTQIANDEPKLPQSIDTRIPKDLETVVLKAIRKDREDRYSSANELADDLRCFLDDKPITAKPPTTTERLARWSRQHKTLVRASLVVMLFLTIGLAISTFLIDRERRRANEAASRERDQKAIAVNERNSAVMARDREQQARERAQLTLELMIKSLRSPDPKRSGRDVKVVEVLRQAESTIEEDLANQPEMSAKLLFALGKTYQGLGLYTDAVRCLDKTHDLILVDRGRNQVDAISFTSHLAEAYHDAGRLSEAVELQEQSFQSTNAIFGIDHPDTLSAATALGKAYLRAGRFLEAIRLQKKTLAYWKKLGCEDDPNSIESMVHLMKSLTAAGRSVEAIELGKKTLSLSKTAMGDEHEQTLQAMHELACAYRSAERFDSAIAMHKETIEKQNRVIGKENLDTLVSMHDLALTYNQADRLEDAIMLFEKTIELMEPNLGAQHPETLIATNNLANAFSKAGRYEESIELAEKVIEIYEASLGQQHPKTLASMNYLGRAYERANRIDDAVKTRKKALEFRQEILGKKHPDTLVSMNNLASTYAKAGRFDESAELYQRAFQHKKSVLGETHQSTIVAMDNLAKAFSFAGRHDEAIKLWEKAVEVDADNRGERHSATLISMNNLAGGYKNVGRYAEAIELIDKVIRISKEKFGDAHAETLRAIHNQAVFLSEAGRWDEAVELYENILEIQKAELGESNPVTLSCMQSLASTYCTIGRFTDALELAEKVYEIRSANLRDGHQRTLFSMNVVATIYSKMGRLEEALKLRQRSYELHRANLGETNPYTVDSMNNLAFSFVEVGRYDEAIPMLKNAIESRTAQIGGTHPNTLHSRNKLASVYYLVGRNDEAIELFEKTLEQTSATLGDDHQFTINSMNGLAKSCHSSGHEEKAIRLYRKVLEVARQKANRNDKLADALDNLASILLDQGEFQEAEGLASESRRIYAELESKQWRRYNTMCLLGDALAGQGKFEQAEPLLLDGFAGMQQRHDTIPFADKIHPKKAMHRIAELYQAWNKPEKAAEWQRRLGDFDAGK